MEFSVMQSLALAKFKAPCCFYWSHDEWHDTQKPNRKSEIKETHRVLSQAISHSSFTTTRSPIHLAQPQLSIESLGTRLSTQKVLKRLHFILRTTPFEHSMSVTSTFLAIHRILLKDSVEHIRRVDLRGQVTVVSGIIATNQVAESGLTVSPVEALTELLGSVERADFFAEGVV